MADYCMTSLQALQEAHQNIWDMFSFDKRALYRHKLVQYNSAISNEDTTLRLLSVRASIQTELKFLQIQFPWCDSKGQFNRQQDSKNKFLLSNSR